MFLSLFKASGHSMEPDIHNGSFCLVSSLPYFIKQPRIKDKIVFKNDNKIIVKKINKIENRMYHIEGVNLSDSKKFKPLKRGNIIGKVIWIF